MTQVSEIPTLFVSGSWPYTEYRVLPQGYGYKVLLLDNLVADDSTIKCQVSKDR